MKWLRKWYYLILFLGAGMVYLTCVDNWQVYAKSVSAVQGWYKELRAEAGDREPDNIPRKDPNETFGEIQYTVPSITAMENTAPPVSADSDSPAGQTGTAGSGTQRSDRELPGKHSPAEKEPGEESPAGFDAPQVPAQREIVYRTVEDDYFADAVFIGDSRTVGMHDYGGLEEITVFYASQGLTVYKMFTSEIVSVPGQKKKITVEEALQDNEFAKIYLMIGINEMGTGTVDTFIRKYEEVVTHLRELQPDAVIYLQGIMKVTTKRSGQGDYVTNEGIEERNERIAQLADNDKVFYLDVNPPVCDETGGMIESYTYDGVHLKGKYIDIWKQFLKEHVVELRDPEEAGAESGRGEEEAEQPTRQKAGKQKN